MKMPIADVADRYTILLLKLSHGLQIDEDLETYKKELEGVDYGDLAKINGRMWSVEELLSTDPPIDVLGSLCLRLRKWNLHRVEAKNRIAEEHGGPIERKTY